MRAGWSGEVQRPQYPSERRPAGTPLAPHGLSAVPSATLPPELQRCLWGMGCALSPASRAAPGLCWAGVNGQQSDGGRGSLKLRSEGRGAEWVLSALSTSSPLPPAQCCQLSQSLRLAEDWCTECAGNTGLECCYLLHLELLFCEEGWSLERDTPPPPCNFNLNHVWCWERPLKPSAERSCRLLAFQSFLPAKH